MNFGRSGVLTFYLKEKKGSLRSLCVYIHVCEPIVGTFQACRHLCIVRNLREGRQHINKSNSLIMPHNILRADFTGKRIGCRFWDSRIIEWHYRGGHKLNSSHNAHVESALLACFFWKACACRLVVGHQAFSSRKSGASSMPPTTI